MSRTFTKLFSSITESTVWCEPDRTRLTWICMLAMADSRGRVWGSVPGLANRARIPVEDARTAIATFLMPDPDSRTPDHQGRRIEPIDGGWRLLNHEKYRAIRDEESRNESKRNHINTKRANERAAKATLAVGVDTSRPEATAGDRCRDNAEADTEAEALKETSSLAESSRRSSPPSAESKYFTGDNFKDFTPRMLVQISERFELSEDWGNDAVALGFLSSEVLREAEKFRQYWTKGKGAGKRRTLKGWRQSWSNWLSKAAERKQ